MFKKVKLIFNNKLVARIFFTLFILIVFMIGNNIQIPFLASSIKESLNVAKLFRNQGIDTPLFGFSYDSLNLLSLSIYPYLTVSIFIQLAQKLIPYLKELREQGEIGRQKLNRLTRIFAIFLAFIQSYMMLASGMFLTGEIGFNDKIFISFFLTTGTAISIWLADLITVRGVGNGFSLLIMIGISKSVIKMFRFMNTFWAKANYQLFFSIFFLLLFILITTIIVYLAFLKINIVYPNKRGQVDNYIPLKLNSSGVLPIIFVSTLQQFLYFLLKTFGKYFNNNFDSYFRKFIFYQNKLGFVFFISLIILFSFLISFLTVNPNDIAEHLSKQDAYIEKVRPGEQTMQKLSYDLFRVTFLGVFFMVFLFSMPQLMNFILSANGHDTTNPLSIGGTSFLIIVGVAIETLQQINSTMNKENYSQIF